MKEILDEKYGMFVEFKETNTIWFHHSSFEEETMFHLIGVIAGLAIYNKVSLAVWSLISQFNYLFVCIGHYQFAFPLSSLQEDSRRDTWTWRSCILGSYAL